MSFIRRITRSSSRREPPPPPPPEDPVDDSGSSSEDSDSSDYSESAKELEEKYGISIPTRRMFRKVINLDERKMENTCLVNLGVFKTLGVENDFLALTGKVGFKPTFWKICTKAYVAPTVEFLASLELLEDNRGRSFIRFRLNGDSHECRLSRFGKYFGFSKHFDASNAAFRDGWGKEKFWAAITGKPVTGNRDYKASNIQHPVLRILHRALTCTIYARGESANRGNNSELELMDTMLAPDAPRPDLARMMVQHWIGLRNQKRTKGSIRVGSYITHLALQLNIEIDRSSPCTGTSILDLSQFQSYKYIKVAGQRNNWLLEGRASFHLPFPIPFEADNQNTWLIPIEYAPHAAVPRSASLHDEDEPEQPNLWEQFHAQPAHQAEAGTSQAPQQQSFSAGQPHEQGNMHEMLSEILRMQQGMHQEIGEIRRLSEDTSQRLDVFGQGFDDLRNRFDDYDARFDRVDDFMHNMNFYHQYGYYPGGYDDPNLGPNQGDAPGEGCNNPDESFGLLSISFFISFIVLNCALGTLQSLSMGEGEEEN